jgi:hypothetical protein
MSDGTEFEHTNFKVTLKTSRGDGFDPGAWTQDHTLAKQVKIL